MHIIGENEYERQSADMLAARYRSQRTLGEDSQARYLGAIDASLGDRVIMVIARTPENESPERQEEMSLARLRQARAAAVMPNADMGHVMEIGRTAGGHPFVVSSLGDGVLLSEQLRSGKPFAATRALAVVVRAAEILSDAHDQGIIHGSVGVHTISVGMRTILTGAVPAAVQLHAFGVAAAPIPASEIPMGEHERMHESDTSVAARREDVRRLVLAFQTMLTGTETAGRRPGTSVPAALAPIFRRAFSPDRGFASADELREALSAASVELADPPAQPAVLPGGWEPPRESGGGWLAFALAALVIAIASVYVLVRYERNASISPPARVADRDTVVSDSVAGFVVPTLPAALATGTGSEPDDVRPGSSGTTGNGEVSGSAGDLETPARAVSRDAGAGERRASEQGSAQIRTRRVVAPPAPPLPASSEVREGINRTLQNYARALESERVSAVASAYPSLSAAERTRLASFFGSIDDLKVALSLGNATVRGDSATARVTGEYLYRDLRSLQDERTPILFIAVLVVRGGVWEIRSIR